MEKDRMDQEIAALRKYADLLQQYVNTQEQLLRLQKAENRQLEYESQKLRNLIRAAKEIPE